MSYPLTGFHRAHNHLPRRSTGQLFPIKNSWHRCPKRRTPPTKNGCEAPPPFRASPSLPAYKCSARLDSPLLSGLGPLLSTPPSSESRPEYACSFYELCPATPTIAYRQGSGNVRHSSPSAARMAGAEVPSRTPSLSHRLTEPLPPSAPVKFFHSGKISCLSAFLSKKALPTTKSGGYPSVLQFSVDSPGGAGRLSSVEEIAIIIFCLLGDLCPSMTPWGTNTYLLCLPINPYPRPTLSTFSIADRDAEGPVKLFA